MSVLRQEGQKGVDVVSNSATEELRRLLDERGVEWKAFSDTYTVVSKWKLVIVEDEGLLDARFFGGLTPAQLMQAMEAALGRGECHIECFDDGIDEALDGSMVYETPTWYLSCGHDAHEDERPNYCPTCGRRVKEDS